MQLVVRCRYIIGMLLLQTVPAAMSEAMRAMVVKQGITVSDVGKAEINAAFSGLGDMINVIAPTIWGALYSMFLTSQPGSLRAKVFGPGGHFMVASAVLVLSWAVLKAVPDDSLFLSNDDEASVDTPRPVVAGSGQVGADGFALPVAATDADQSPYVANANYKAAPLS